MGTWKDILKSKGVDAEGQQRQKRIDREACVVHALQSIAGCEAPAEVFDQRLKQLDAFPGLADISRASLETGVDEWSLIERALAEDRAAILDLILRTSEQDTPFGLCLARYTPEFIRITSDDLKRNIRDQVPFMAFGKIRYEGETGETGHAIHVGLVDSEKFISLSDPLMEFTQPRTPNDLFFGIIFHPKQQA